MSPVPGSGAGAEQTRQEIFSTQLSDFGPESEAFFVSHTESECPNTAAFESQCLCNVELGAAPL